MPVTKSSESPSRLKGIETAFRLPCPRQLRIFRSERPSRLKGIETLFWYLQWLPLCRLGSERPSRLKGIETLKRMEGGKGGRMEVRKRFHV